MTPVVHHLPVVADTCGTGATATKPSIFRAPLPLASRSRGVPVRQARRNRSASSRCGSADVFEALGIPVDVPARISPASWRRRASLFSMRQAHHSSPLSPRRQARRELGTRTIFQRAWASGNHAGYPPDWSESRRRAPPNRCAGSRRIGSQRACVVPQRGRSRRSQPCVSTRVRDWSVGHKVRDSGHPRRLRIERIDRQALAGERQRRTRPRWPRSSSAGKPHRARASVDSLTRPRRRVSISATPLVFAPIALARRSTGARAGDPRTMEAVALRARGRKRSDDILRARGARSPGFVQAPRVGSRHVPFDVSAALRRHPIDHCA